MGQDCGYRAAWATNRARQLVLTIGSVCSGIGGLELGLERAGLGPTIWQAETDAFCSQVLAKHWPGVPNYGDITTADWSTVERPDLICGGYPCQPFSLAGARRGTADARHLWPAVIRAVRVLRPRYVVLENVAGHLGLGFGDVLGDLASSGYDASWDCIPASAVGAPHRRDRVWIVATDTVRERGRQEPFGECRRGDQADIADDGAPQPLADTHACGRRANERDLHARQSDTARRGEAVADATLDDGPSQGAQGGGLG